MIGNLEINDIERGQMLNDKIIHFCQQLMSIQLDIIVGLQDPIKGKVLSFNIHPTTPFVQVFHDGNLLWVDQDILNKKTETKIAKIPKKNLQKRKLLTIIMLKKKIKSFNFLTGISKLALFEWVLEKIKPCVRPIIKAISLENHLLIILMTLRLRHKNKDLALRFNISEGLVSKIFCLWIK